MQTEKYLEQVGDRHRFQIYSIVFVCLKWLIVSLTVFLPSYLFITPTFTCGTDIRVTQSEACQKISLCHINEQYTITAHAHLYCDDKYLRDSIISSEFIGSVCGLILLSILADKLGRKIIIVCTLYFTTIGSILLTLGASFINLPIMYIGLLLMGFGGYSLSMVSYSYLSEINNDLWRQKSLILTYSFWALGEIMLFPIIRWIGNWQWICLCVLILPLIGLMIMSVFISQTPEFLWVQKRYDQCLKSLNYIARFNKQPQLPSLLIPPKQSQAQPEKITDTFTKSKYLIPLIVLSFAQVCNNGLYYTTQYSINLLGKSFEVNMLIIGILELVSCLVTNHYCERMYRKRWIMSFMVIAGGIGLILQFTTESSEFQIVLISISRILNTFSFALFGLITTQSFPTSIRSTGTGISEAFSNLGNMGAPFLVTFSNDIGVKGVLIGGIVCIAGGASMIFVKQTKKKEENNPLLNQTTEEYNQQRVISLQSD